MPLKNQQLRLPRGGAASLASLTYDGILLQFNFTRVLNNATQGMMHEVRGQLTSGRRATPQFDSTQEADLPGAAAQLL